MPIGNLHGRARLSIRSPTAQAECDRCGIWYDLSHLRKQFQWAGSALIDTGYLVCPDTCLDVPFEQYRTLILPPDPVPRTNPRPSYDTTAIAYPGLPAPTTPGNQGFTQYVLGSTPGTYPTVPDATGKSAALAAVASLSGVPTPGDIVDRSIVITPANTTRTLMAVNASRSWLLVYNPSAPQAQIAIGGTALWGSITNLILGPGEAYFWATAQGLGTVFQGAITAIGLTPNVELWAWDAV